MLIYSKSGWVKAKGSKIFKEAAWPSGLRR